MVAIPHMQTQVHAGPCVFRSLVMVMSPDNENEVGKLERHWMIKHEEKWHDQDAPRDVQDPG